MKGFIKMEKIKKVAERSNVLTESENKSFIHSIINAVTKGYSDGTVLEDIMELIRRREVSKGVIQAAPDALRSYAESIRDSLVFLAEQMENLEVIDEPTIKRREIKLQEQIDEQIQAVPVENTEEKTFEQASKNASLNKFANLEVSEDWDQYSYNKKSNTMSGHLIISFKEDMNKFKNANKVSLSSEDTKKILSSVYSYFSKEYKNLKSSLNEEIFKGNIKFSSLEKGVAEVDYLIEGAF